MTSDQTQRRILIALSTIGLVVALYLVYIKLFPASLLCVGVGDCEAVNNSIYSEIQGIPVAVFGALAYAFLMGLLALEKRLAFLEAWGPILVFGTALAGTLYSGYLTYIELAVIHKICPYCVTSAVVMTLIFVISSLRLKRYL
jgi:uncharacterized membrane protein